MNRTPSSLSSIPVAAAGLAFGVLAAAPGVAAPARVVQAPDLEKPELPVVAEPAVQPAATRPPIERLTIHPARVTLDSAADRHRVVVVAVDAAGVTRDVTVAAELSSSAESVAEVAHAPGAPEPVAASEDAGAVVRWVRGVGEGRTELRARYGGREARASVEVRDARGRPPVSFRNDVVPVLTRQGCNAGACHGAAAGKNGFKLSLFGYDPARDHRALTRELRGRRVDAARPELSLMLRKPSRQVKHKGGRRLDDGGPRYRLLRRWIEEGAVDDANDAAEVERIVLEPAELVLAGPDQRVQVVVSALYSDGRVRDVTELSLLSSSSGTVATVDARGRVTSGARGEAFVLARFDEHAQVAQVIVLPDGEPYRAPKVPAFDPIDEPIHAKLQKLRLTPAEVCDDRTFVRRVYLDVIGKLPTPEETERFVADRSPKKRARLVDRLLERPEFPEVWAQAWAEVLRVESRLLRAKGTVLYDRWLRDAFREARPIDRIVHDLLTATGSNFDDPAASLFVTVRDPKELVENVAQAFLGIRVQCAQCHNHPFERWTMDDYYSFAAFFAQVGRKRGEDPREMVIYDRRRGEVRKPGARRNAVPRFLGGEAPEIAKGVDRRAVLADWLCSPDNPYFAENVANRVWKRFFGRGIVEPVDDRRVSNPPSHPELYRLLGRILADSGFDLRELVRRICGSRTYQLAVHPGSPPAAAYAGAPVRRLGAEQLLDSIDQVTGVPTDFRGLPTGASATELPDGNPRNRFLDLFGRPRRKSVCACERRDDPTLNQVLHLINGETIERKIRADDGRLARALERGRAPEAIVEELFLAAYSRPPEPEEVAAVVREVQEAGGARAAWEDAYWAVLNSKEFLFQH